MPYSTLFTASLAFIGHTTAAAWRRQDSQHATISTVDTDNGFNVTDSEDKLKIFTSYLFNDCSPSQMNDLKEAVADANEIAYAGIKILAVPGGPPRPWIDFDAEPAIEYFGPPSKNGDQQRKIFTTLQRSSYAYSRWGDWWFNRYVQLNCNATLVAACANGTVVAATSNANKDFGYPLITFCPIFFDKLPSFGAAIRNVEESKDPNRKNNVLSMRNKGSTMLHEWIHMNWSSAEVCPGGAIDNIMKFGPEKEEAKAYKAGRAKLLAKRNVKKAANNNDNYVYYSLAWWMRRRYGSFPQYPTAWDPKKSVADNLKDEANQPGNPPPLQPFDGADDMVDDDNGDDSTDESIVDDPLYVATEYPDWYQPIVSAVLPTTSPATLPVVTPPPEPTELPDGAITTTLDDSPSSAPPSPTEAPTPAPSSASIVCKGNQVQGDCVQGHLPDTGPNGGPQRPVCNKIGTGNFVRVSDTKAKDAARQYCQNLIDGKVVLDAKASPPKAGLAAGAAENGGQLSLAVLFNVNFCDANTKPEDQKVEFGAMSLDDCFMNMYTSLATVCAQDPTWGDFNKDFPLEGGVFGFKCAMWSMSGNKA